jgi:hypothetical protein
MSIAAVGLATLIPTTMMLGVEWQAFQHDLNILVNSVHLLVSTLFHVAVFGWKKSMLYTSEPALAFIFIALVASFTVYFIVTKLCKHSRQHLH